MDADARRDLLRIVSNPEGKLDYVIVLKGRIGTAQEARRAAVQLRYVPDKYILEDAAFSRYLDALADADWGSFEELAALILHDLNNEVVARWTQVSVSAAAAEGSERRHAVVIEDRQPNWDNPAILARLD